MENIKKHHSTEIKHIQNRTKDERQYLTVNQCQQKLDFFSVKRTKSKQNQQKDDIKLKFV